MDLVVVEKLSNYFCCFCCGGNHGKDAPNIMCIASKRITVVGNWEPAWFNFLY